MTTPKKKLGIWMDHSTAHAMDLNADSIQTKTFISRSTHEEKERSLGKGENLMHNKEQQLQLEYYNLIKNMIRDFDEVLLFGPTKAKNELVNLVKEDILFEKINVNVRDTDKMTENQQHAFVRNYFSENHSAGKTISLK